MRKLYEVKKGAISIQLEKAVTRVSFSFDMGTSPNRYALQNTKFLRETDGAVSIAAYDKFLELLLQLRLSPSTELLVNGPSSSTLLIYISNTLGISPNGRQFLLARQYFQS